MKVIDIDCLSLSLIVLHIRVSLFNIVSQRREMKFLLDLTWSLVILSQAAAQCPFSSRSRTLSQSRSPSSPSPSPSCGVSGLTLSFLGGRTLIENYQESGVEAVKVVNFDEVRTDLRAVMFDSQEVGLSPAGQPAPALCCV